MVFIDVSFSGSGEAGMESSSLLTVRSQCSHSEWMKSVAPLSSASR